MAAAAAAAPLLLLAAALLPGAAGHGRLIEPPSRGSMWRYGFHTPPDYNDHELYCGGFSRQWQRNGGRCGVCGDAWDLPEPRPHESGGAFGQGPVVRRYRPGAAIPLRVELTANHRGYFEFRLCPRDSPLPEATQACLDGHVLTRAPPGRGAPGAGDTRYFPEAGSNRVFEARYRLPAGVRCSHCVLQWRYIAGNNWGRCENGTEGVGCGPQEEFRACADVAVEGEGDGSEEDSGEEATPGQPGQPGQPAPQRHQRWWVPLATVFCALLSAVTALLLVYVYYYHAADAAKQWLQSRRSAVAMPA